MGKFICAQIQREWKFNFFNKYYKEDSNMQKNHKETIRVSSRHAVLSEINAVKLEREEAREIRSISKGLANRLNLQPDGQDLLGLIGAYNDKNNVEAIRSWMYKFKGSGQLSKVIDCEERQNVISCLALKIRTEIEEMYY